MTSSTLVSSPPFEVLASFASEPTVLRSQVLLWIGFVRKLGRRNC